MIYDAESLPEVWAPDVKNVSSQADTEDEVSNSELVGRA